MIKVCRLKLVTFDVTDTLLQFRSSLGAQYSEVGAAHGVVCSQDALAANFKTHWYKLQEEHPNFGRATGLGWERWWRTIVFRTFQDAALGAEESKLEAIAAELIELYKSEQCWQQSYGAIGLLSYLRNRGVALGVVSNFDERLPALLQSTRLRHYFRFVLTSYEAGVEKPDGRIFAEAARRAAEPGRAGPRPHECLHVGDTARLDYAGARAAGWHAALVTNSAQVAPTPGVPPAHLFRNLYDLHKELVEGNAQTNP